MFNIGLVDFLLTIDHQEGILKLTHQLYTSPKRIVLHVDQGYSTFIDMEPNPSSTLPVCGPCWQFKWLSKST